VQKYLKSFSPSSLAPLRAFSGLGDCEIMPPKLKGVPGPFQPLLTPTCPGLPNSVAKSRAFGAAPTLGLGEAWCRFRHSSVPSSPYALPSDAAYLSSSLTEAERRVSASRLCPRAHPCSMLAPAGLYFWSFSLLVLGGSEK